MACGAEDVALAVAMDVQTGASGLAIPTIRSVAVDLAVRAEFDLDAVEELGMAVDEACTVLVGVAAPDARLRCRFTVGSERVGWAAEVDIDQVTNSLPVGSLSWQVLRCLTDDINAVVVPPEPREQGRVCIALTKHPMTGPRP